MVSDLLHLQISGFLLAKISILTEKYHIFHKKNKLTPATLIIAPSISRKVTR